MHEKRERIHSKFLLPAIVFLMVAQPVAASLLAAEAKFLALPLAVTLGAVAWSLDDSRRGLRVSGGLCLAVLASFVGRELTGVQALIVAEGVLMIVLAGLCIVLGIRALARSAEVRSETLLVALSVYLVIGMAFGLLFDAFYFFEPSWFEGVSARGQAAATADLLYFSMTTLTTVGYGDIHALHPIPRVVSNVEAVVGQLYLAVLVAWLVAGYTMNRPPPAA